MDDIHKIKPIISRLEECNISITIDGSDLLLHLNGTPLDPVLREEIKNNKRQIINYLNDYSAGIQQGSAASQNLQKHAGLEKPDLTEDIRESNHRDIQERDVVGYFQHQCKNTPAAIALTFNDNNISYSELDSASTQLANKLSALEIAFGDRVAVFMDRTPELITVMLAIMKLGAVYVPIDTTYPKGRLSFICEDAGVKLLLIQEHLEDSLPGVQARVVSVGNIEFDVQTNAHGIDALVGKESTSSESSAYVIYTSGSTGSPKGVEISHGSLINMLLQITSSLKLTKADVILALASISFDVSLFELLAPLIIGAKIFLLDDENIRNPESIAYSLKHKAITMVSASPAMWRLLNNYDWSTNRNITLISGGEALPKDLAYELLKRNGNLWNLYGPTEGTIVATHKHISSEKDISTGSTLGPIGQALNGCTTYILDENLQPVPPGVPGELFIGGKGVAKGYVNNSALTSEKFIQNPFSKNRKERLYRTGDIVKYLTNHDIEYIRRIDNQVNLNGYRIELGEIESLLKNHRSIKDAVITVSTITKKRFTLISAYLVPEKGTPNKDKEILNEYLAEFLPGYMLPGRYYFLNEIPLNSNGKVDYKALPVPELTNKENCNARPRDETEREIASIFCDVLEIDKIGIYDSFFDVGGTSMLAAVLLLPINDQFGLDIKLKEILSVPPTVSNVASLVKEYKNSPGPA